jgi:hypothetical protein
VGLEGRLGGHRGINACINGSMESIRVVDHFHPISDRLRHIPDSSSGHELFQVRPLHRDLIATRDHTWMDPENIRAQSTDTLGNGVGLWTGFPGDK